jgi:hypothetical protein
MNCINGVVLHRGFGTPRDVFNPFQTQIGVKVKF